MALANLPLVLRKESFGGRLFVPENAVRMEVDPEGYEFLRDFYRSSRPARSADEHALVKHLLALGALSYEQGEFRGRKLRLVEEPVGPILVDFQVTNCCFQACPQCYAESHPAGAHVPVTDFEALMPQLAAAGVFQMALGGGEPLAHPQFASLVEAVAAAGMLPNLTTTGHGLTPEALAVIKEHCGAVALSLEDVAEDFSVRRRYGFSIFHKTMEKFLESGVPLTLHVTLSRDTLKNLPRIVEYCKSLAGSIYGVIFLAYKPIGRGACFDGALVELTGREVFDALVAALVALRPLMNMGYDCCLAPAIAGVEKILYGKPSQLFDGCSAFSSSVAILPDLSMCGCSFSQHESMGNLRVHSFRDIWNGMLVSRGRKEDVECAACAWETQCRGGCPFWPLVPCPVKNSMGKAEVSER